LLAKPFGSGSIRKASVANRNAGARVSPLAAKVNLRTTRVRVLDSLAPHWIQSLLRLEEMLVRKVGDAIYNLIRDAEI
jgi:hypothetical protein